MLKLNPTTNHKAVFGLATILLLSACASSRVEQSRKAVTGMKGDESIVILGQASIDLRETEDSFIGCMSKILQSGKSPIKVVAPQAFKDSLYPWFEPRIEPTSASDLSELFAQPGVRERIKSEQIRYLAWITGDTNTINKGGSMSCTVTTFGGGCFGMNYWEEDASYEASIWDLENLSLAGQISADATGTSYVAGLIIPIPILARPGNAACRGLANQLIKFVGGDQ